MSYQDLTPVFLQEIISLLEHEPFVEVVWLYGSRVDGTSTAESDFDIAVAFKEPLKKGLEQRLKTESLVAKISDALNMASSRLSIVDINLIPLQLAMSVVEKGRVLLSKNTLREAKEENRITSMWELDHEYHRRQFG